jgi:hypothetical protein
VGENEGRRQERVEGGTKERKKGKIKKGAWKIRKFKEHVVD